LETATPWGPLVFDYRTEQTGFWQRLEVVHDGTIALARTGIVFLRVPPVSGGGQAHLRLRLDRGLLPVAPRIVRVAFNVLPIVQLETRTEEVLGESNGLPDQRFSLDLVGLPAEGDEAEVRLSDNPVSPAPSPTAREGEGTSTAYKHLRIEVEADQACEEWQPSDDLTTCGPQDRVYEIDVASGQIRFGNGLNGLIPPLGAQVLHRDYHLTVGAGGNLRSGLTWRVKGVTTKNEVYGNNPQPLSGGEDAWDAQRLQQQARETVLRRNVLLQDSELLAAATGLSGYGVARAAVLSRFHPAFPEAEIPGARTLVVVPWRDSGDDEGPAVDSAYPAAVAAALRPRRVLGERLTVIAARPVPVRVRAELLVEAGVDATRIETEAVALLNARLSDIAVGDQVDPWPIGRPVTVGEIKTLLAGIDRVIAVPCCELARDEGAFATESIMLLRFEVAIGGRHEIAVRHLATE
jgi:predicted phage baseplate assembly protein